MRTLCSSTLIGEFFIIGFAGLVAMKDPDLAQSTVWTVCGIAMFFSVLLCGMVTRPGGVALGWALQVALVAAGFVVPTMFVLGILFGALWWASVHYGRVIDEAKARFAAQHAEHAGDGPAGPGTPAAPGSADTADAV